KKNKPKEPPKVPQSAPFFIPTVPGLVPRFAVPEQNGDPQQLHLKMLPSEAVLLEELVKLSSQHTAQSSEDLSKYLVAVPLVKSSPYAALLGKQAQILGPNRARGDSATSSDDKLKTSLKVCTEFQQRRPARSWQPQDTLLYHPYKL
ncbi:hypothetical protein A6R68_01521, partial [Neotoma lepida]